MRHTFDHDSTFYVHETGSTDLYGILRPWEQLDNEWLFNAYFALALSGAKWNKGIGLSGVLYKGLIKPGSENGIKPFWIVRQNVPSPIWDRTFAITKSKMKVFAGDNVKVHQVKIPRHLPIQKLYELTEGFSEFSASRRRPL